MFIKVFELFSYSTSEVVFRNKKRIIAVKRQNQILAKTEIFGDFSFLGILFIDEKKIMVLVDV